MPRKKTLTCSTVPGNCRSPILDNPYPFNIALNSKGNPALTKPQADVDVFPAQFDLRVRMCCKHSPDHTSAPPRWLRLGSQRVINLLGAALLSPAEQPSGYSPTHATYAADFGTAQTNSLPALSVQRRCPASPEAQVQCLFQVQDGLIKQSAARSLKQACLLAKHPRSISTGCSASSSPGGRARREDVSGSICQARRGNYRDF